MADSLYDEFGNYIGPELSDEEVRVLETCPPPPRLSRLPANHAVSMHVRMLVRSACKVAEEGSRQQPILPHPPPSPGPCVPSGIDIECKP